MILYAVYSVLDQLSDRTVLSCGEAVYHTVERIPRMESAWREVPDIWGVALDIKRNNPE